MVQGLLIQFFQNIGVFPLFGKNWEIVILVFCEKVKKQILVFWEILFFLDMSFFVSHPWSHMFSRAHATECNYNRLFLRQNTGPRRNPMQCGRIHSNSDRATVTQKRRLACPTFRDCGDCFNHPRLRRSLRLELVVPTPPV